MQWFARDDRHSSEVFRAFGVKFQLSPKPAETQTVQVCHITEQIHFAVFSNLSSSGGATETMSCLVSFPATRRATSRPELSGNI
jgi:hypothetical protein